MQDVGNSWYSPNYTTLLGQIMDQYINQTQTLYNSGARRFLFLTVPPIQLTPSVQDGGASNVEAEGATVKQYNDALKSRIAAFAAANPLAKTYLVDTTAPFLKAIDDPQAYGADNATCFDSSGTKCLWWNDVSVMPFFLLCLWCRKIDRGSIIPVWQYRSS
jgi:phospholipase/lecithinase/hemolysin